MVRIVSVHETYGRNKYEILKAVIILCDSLGEALRALVTNPTSKWNYFSPIGSRSLEKKPNKMVITGNFTFNYSMKNIPNATKSQYEAILVESIESLINRMRWKLFWLKSPIVSSNKKETFGFKSALKAPADKDLKRFEDDLIKLVSNLEMKKAHNAMQDKLKKDMRLIKEKKEIIVKADKTDNHYLIPVDEYKKLMVDNITKDYRREDIERVNSINREAAKIAKDLELDDRIEAMALKSAFLTIKDHKEDWPAKVSCRLINPTKSNIGTVSKHILDRVNSQVKEKLGINQWKSTGDAIEWFKNLNEKKSLKFVKFDIEKFYPSISKQLLTKALSFAKEYTSVTRQEEEIIFHARRNVLVDHEGKIWVKKSDREFDVSMGSTDGAEVSELVGSYLISKLMEVFDKNIFGIYRDDGLMVVKGGGPEADRARKNLFRIFKNEDLKITTECNISRVSFLDIELDLTKGTTKPFIKPNSATKYVSTSSSHPPSIIKNLPSGVARRLTAISTNKDMFDQEVNHYQAAIEQAGYKDKLEFIEKENVTEETDNKTKRKSREAIWFNPPWSNNVRTNVGGKFISLLKKHFPRTSPLHSIFNTKKIKVSYKTTKNMSAVISNHNKRILSSSRAVQNNPGCNCRDGEDTCPMGGKCLDREMVYKAEVKTSQGNVHYYGQTARTFKERFYGHTSDLRHRSKTDSTTLLAKSRRYINGCTTFIPGQYLK